MRKRHSVLVLNIGTFAEEDEAYERLNGLNYLLFNIGWYWSVLGGSESILGSTGQYLVVLGHYWVVLVSTWW